jgi:hypothetical protein
VLEQIGWEEISFRLGGRLLNVGAQIGGGVSVKDSWVKKVTGGDVIVEAYNKQNLTVTAKLGRSKKSFNSV